MGLACQMCAHLRHLIVDPQRTGCAVVVQAHDTHITELKELNQTAAVAAEANTDRLQQQLSDQDGSLVSLKGALATAEQTCESAALQVHFAPFIQCVVSHTIVTVF